MGGPKCDKNKSVNRFDGCDIKIFYFVKKIEEMRLKSREKNTKV